MKVSTVGDELMGRYQWHERAIGSNKLPIATDFNAFISNLLHPIHYSLEHLEQKSER